MKCDCQPVEQHEPYHFTGCGLKTVYLRRIKRRQCDVCGADSVIIWRLSQVFRLIAWKLATRPGRLEPDEIGFLRDEMGLKQGEFADLLGVQQPVLCRWETGAKRQSHLADLAIRLEFMLHGGREDLPWEDEFRREWTPFLGSLVREGQSGPLPIEINTQEPARNVMLQTLEEARRNGAA